MSNRRQQRRINRAVAVQADAVAEVVGEAVIHGRTPPYRFNASHPPDGVTPEDYADRIGYTAVSYLRVMLEHPPVTYSGYASRQATGEFPALHPDQKVSREPDDVIIVFVETE